MIPRVVELSKIRIDGGTQPREAIDQQTVDEYAESYAALVKMPPVVIYFDGVDAWLADGFHRYHAAKKSGVQAIDADWREGTLEMAKFYAAGANVGHGLRRKDADKKRAILMLLETSQGKKWAAEKGNKGSGLTAVARHCGVSVAWVTMVVGSFKPENSQSRSDKRAAIEKALEDRPDAPANAIKRELEAKGVKVDHKTVAAVREEKARCAAKCEAPDPVPATEPAPEHSPEPTPPKPAASYSSRSVADAAKIVTDTLRMARGSFVDADWSRLIGDVEKIIAVREYGTKE